MDLLVKLLTLPKIKNRALEFLHNFHEIYEFHSWIGYFIGHLYL